MKECFNFKNTWILFIYISLMYRFMNRIQVEMVMKVSSTRWHKRIDFRFMLPYRLPAWQHNSQSLCRKSFIWSELLLCDLFPLADDVLKMYLGDGPEAGAQVLMWKPWQVWPRMEYILLRGPVEIRCSSERQCSNYSNMHIIIFLTRYSDPCYNLHTSKYI